MQSLNAKAVLTWENGLSEVPSAHLLSNFETRTVIFFFSFVYVMYLNIASYLYGKQIKSKVWNKLYNE